MRLAVTLWLLAIATLFVVAAILMNAEAHRGFWYWNA